jgi:CHAT domain-containing protein/Flp pilus assembly protein TadD
MRLFQRLFPIHQSLTAWQSLQRNADSGRAPRAQNLRFFVMNLRKLPSRKVLRPLRDRQHRRQKARRYVALMLMGLSGSLLWSAFSSLQIDSATAQITPSAPQAGRANAEHVLQLRTEDDRPHSVSLPAWVKPRPRQQLWVKANPVQGSEPKQTGDGDALLQVNDALTDSDDVLNDGSRYDAYRFDGQAGQTISIIMESHDFDTYLMLFAPNGQRIAENDDIAATNRNSQITITLPVGGTYQIFANAYDARGQGQYVLSVFPGMRSPSPGNQSPEPGLNNPVSQADVLSEAGYQLWQQGDLQTAMELLNEALRIRRAEGDERGIAEDLMGIGVVSTELGLYDQALDAYDTALSFYRENDIRAGEATALNNMGAVYDSQGFYARAAETYEQALVIRRELGNLDTIATTLHNLGQVSVNRGQFNDAIANFEQALDLRQQVGNQREAATALQSMGGAYSFKGDYRQALSLLEQALSIHESLGDRIGVIADRQIIGTTYLQLGDIDQAKSELEDALSVSREIESRPHESAALLSLGSIYSHLGQYGQALDYYQQALGISQAIGDRTTEGNILTSIGATYERIGRYGRSLDVYQQALRIHQTIGNRHAEATTLNNIAVVYLQLGQYDDAITTFEQALEIRQVIEDKAGQSQTHNNLANALFDLGQIDRTIEQLEQSLQLAQATESALLEAVTLNNLGAVYRHVDQYPQAIDAYQQSLTIAQAIGNRDGEVNTLKNLAIALFETGQLPQAEQTLKQAILMSESIRNDAGSRDDQISIFDLQIDAYEVLQKVLVAQNKTNEALEFAERSRARVFVEQLAEGFFTSEQVQSEIQSPSLSQIQQIAQAQNATLVEYSMVDVVGRHDLYIWVIQPTGTIEFRQISLDEQHLDLTNLVQGSRAEIGVRGRGFTLETPQQDGQLEGLYDVLIAPIQDLLPENPEDHVIFIPHESLFAVAFPALLTPNGTYLIENHTLTTAPAIQVLDLTQQQRQQRSRNSSASPQADEWLIVGDPQMPSLPTIPGEPAQPLANLPGARQEALAIGQLFGAPVLTDHQATETTVVQQMRDARVIHLATHGLLEYGQSNTSFERDIPGAIALAPSATDDGLLTTRELLDMGRSLRADLVVLSACDTGLGEIRGDGVIGLSRSLFLAGTPSVIVSLWAVPDAPTSELMVEFYRQWQQEGLDKAQALRQAMLTTMQRHPNPRDWAAFTLIGEAE